MLRQAQLFDITPPKVGLDPSTAPEKFDLIYCDPPWSYNEQVFRGYNNPTGCAEDHYPTMSLAELKRMRVKDIAKKNSLCIMWTTGPQLHHAIDLIQSENWSFKYITMAFVWDKCKLNPSKYFMSQTEYAIVGKRGAIPKPRGSYSELQFLSRCRTRHSEKPEEFRCRIDRSFPADSIDKLELFSRRAAPGWYVWGNEAPEGLSLPALDIPW